VGHCLSFFCIHQNLQVAAIGHLGDVDYADDFCQSRKLWQQVRQSVSRPEQEFLDKGDIGFAWVYY